MTCVHKWALDEQQRWYCIDCNEPFVPTLEGPGQARGSDLRTSQEAAKLVRPGSTRRKLLRAHSMRPGGLTDEEAAIVAGLRLSSEYATRCSELKRAFLLRDTSITREGRSGAKRVVRQITEFGIRIAKEMEV